MKDFFSEPYYIQYIDKELRDNSLTISIESISEQEPSFEFTSSFCSAPQRTIKENIYYAKSWGKNTSYKIVFVCSFDVAKKDKNEWLKIGLTEKVLF